MILQSLKILTSTPAIPGFSLREEFLPDYGNMSFDLGDRQSVLANRGTFLQQIGLDPIHLTLVHQEHGTTIHRVRFEQRGRGALSLEGVRPSDGLMTDEPGVPLGILAADCCCLLMADVGGRAVGAFHAGWRGTHAGMAQKAVETFRTDFDVPPSDLRVWISPCISAKNYEVGQEVWEKFEKDWGKDCLLEDPLRVDLPGLNRQQLVEAGIDQDAIEMPNVCTMESERFFSHRRGDEPKGRMLGVIALPLG